MKKPTCDDVADLIDLYAAHECEPAQEKAVRAHLAACADCRRALDESRQMMGLLDVHFSQEAALSRLGARLKAEKRPGRKAAPRVLAIHRFAAVAAMLLVTFGLGVLLLPTGDLRESISLQVALAPRAKPDLDVPGGHDVAHESKASRNDKQAAKDKPLELAKGKAIDLAKEFARGALPPRADVELKVTNPGRTAIELDLGAPEFRCELDLRDPAKVVSREVKNPAYVPFHRSKLKIAPGETKPLRLERLASQVGERVTYLYVKEEGEYELRVRLVVTAWRDGSRQTLRLTAGPMKLPLP